MVDALTDDVTTGNLQRGTRLPTHRELADKLGVAIGTVTRAYSEARERGLISGEVGRGTFVSSGDNEDPFMRDAAIDSTVIDLSRNRVFCPGGEKPLNHTLRDLSQWKDASSLIDEYMPSAGTLQHRIAAANWIGNIALKVDPDQLLICCGAQHAITVALAGIANPGDLILTEQLTYPGLKAVAGQLHLQMHGLPMGDDGLLPGAFEEACRTRSPKALYCIPTLQNPTGTVMSDLRRREIASIAKTYNVAIVEDDLYRFLTPDAPPPISSYAPELSFYITSTSKAMALGLRIGYLVAPRSAVARMATAIRTTVWEASPVMAEIASRWIEDGTAERIILAKRAEVAARYSMARQILGDYIGNSEQIACHIFLQLPEPWRGNDFVAEAKSRNVIVNAADVFAVGRTIVPHAIRICLGSPQSRNQVQSGLEIIKEMLDSYPQPGEMII